VFDMLKFHTFRRSKAVENTSLKACHKNTNHRMTIGVIPNDRNPAQRNPLPKGYVSASYGVHPPPANMVKLNDVGTCYVAELNEYRGQ
jgi:hypothetical protein